MTRGGSPTGGGRPAARSLPYVALLRGINVGGHKRVAMADLRAALEAMGCAEVRSLLQSGNLVFRHPPRPVPQLEARLERVAAERLGLRADFLVRTAAEWGPLVAANPFRDEASRDPGRLAVVFLRDAPTLERVAALRAAISGPERAHVDGRHAYIVYPDGMGRSRLTLALVERTLATRGTARNWNTVTKLGALVGA